MKGTATNGSKTIDNGNFEGLFPFLILLLIGLIRLLKARKKKQQPPEQLPPPRRAEPAPPPPRKAPAKVAKAPLKEPLIPQETEYRSLKVKRDEHFWRKEKKSRIQTLVESTGNKRKVFLLSEILRTPHF